MFNHRLMSAHQIFRVIFFVMLLLQVLGICLMDYCSSRYVSFFALNIIPIALAIWKIGIKSGVFLTIIASVSEFFVDFHLQQEAPLWPLLLTSFIRIGALSALLYVAWKNRVLTTHLKSLSEKDGLTGLLNRRGFFIHGQLELEQIGRLHEAFSVVYLDIDNFKEINDTLGHDTGDRVLRELSSTVKKNIRKMDLFARIGGDEFALILPYTNGVQAKYFGEKMLHLIRKKLFMEKLSIKVSIGIASFNASNISIDYALKCADNLMFKVKKKNKNGVLQKQIYTKNRIKMR